jgi:Icc-related predicted phosphoesterase
LNRVFFTTDIHGSEKCFLKFVASAEYYSANVIILGGDITGKSMVPLVRQRDGTVNCTVSGNEVVLNSETEMQEAEKTLRNSGSYPVRLTQDEYDSFRNDRDEANRLFRQLMRQSVERWVSIAEDRLRGTGVRCYIQLGNDDEPELADIINGSDVIVNPEDHVVWLDDQHEMISSGYSNMTPWSCPRDVTEETLAKQIEAMAEQVHNMESCIFNFHCPPLDTVLDEAPMLDEDLKIVSKMGHQQMAHVGSQAVRDAIERWQPLLGLHGHIHESRGVVKLGSTMCVNPGSEYAEGVLRGVLLTLDEKEVKGYQMTSG